MALLACGDAASPEEVCRKLERLVPVGGDAPPVDDEARARCVEKHKELRAALGDDSYRTYVSCMLAAKDLVAASDCDPVIERGEAGRGPISAHAQKRKTAEARNNLLMLYQGARQRYTEAAEMAEAGTPPPAAPLLAPSTAPIPALGACCRQGGRCAPESSQWQASPWKELGFAIDVPHYYSYEYRVDRSSATFTVLAYGDLDCDGTFSTFSIQGSTGGDQGAPSRLPPIARKNELE